MEKTKSNKGFCGSWGKETNAFLNGVWGDDEEEKDAKEDNADEE